MRSNIVVLLVGLCTFISTAHTAWASSDPEKAVTDPFEVFRTMEYMYGLLDKDDDGDLDCSTAIRTEINEEEQTATYLWVLWGPDGQPMPLSFNYKVIPGSDQATFTIGDGDGLGKTATFLYDDHNGCAVAVLPLFGRPDCVMGVSEEVKTHVPQSCITAFEENCHTKVRGFDKDTCSGWYDDEEIARSHGSI